MPLDMASTRRLRRNLQGTHDVTQSAGKGCVRLGFAESYVETSLVLVEVSVCIKSEILIHYYKEKDQTHSQNSVAAEVVLV